MRNIGSRLLTCLLVLLAGAPAAANPRSVFFAPLRASPALSSLEPQIRRTLTARMLQTGRFVAAVQADTEAAAQRCIRSVNRDVNAQQCWVRVGQGQGAELMVTGSLQGDPTSCDLSLELVHLETRVSTRMHVQSLEPCGKRELVREMRPAAAALAGQGVPASRPLSPPDGAGVPVARPPAGSPSVAAPAPSPQPAPAAGERRSVLLASAAALVPCWSGSFHPGFDGVGLGLAAGKTGTFIGQFAVGLGTTEMWYFTVPLWGLVVIDAIYSGVRVHRHNQRVDAAYAARSASYGRPGLRRSPEVEHPPKAWAPPRPAGTWSYTLRF